MTRDPPATESPPLAPVALHASAVVIGETGVLIRGVSGAGKSSLADALIGEAQRRGLFARLVGDDRVRVERAGGRLSARPHPVIAGLLERRGEGIVCVASEPAVILRLVIDIDAFAGPARLPARTDQTTELRGVVLPRLHLRAGPTLHEQARRIVDSIAAGDD